MTAWSYGASPALPIGWTLWQTEMSCSDPSLMKDLPFHCKESTQQTLGRIWFGCREPGSCSRRSNKWIRCGLRAWPLQLNGTFPTGDIFSRPPCGIGHLPSAQPCFFSFPATSQHLINLWHTSVSASASRELSLPQYQYYGWLNIFSASPVYINWVVFLFQGTSKSLMLLHLSSFMLV